MNTIEPGANPPVDVLPFLWYLPGQWKRRAYRIRGNVDDIWKRARKMVDDRRARGDIRDSVIDTKLSEYEKDGGALSEYAFNNLFGEFLEAGADSTFALCACSSLTSSHGKYAADADYGVHQASTRSGQSAQGAGCRLRHTAFAALLRLWSSAIHQLHHQGSSPMAAHVSNC